MRRPMTAVIARAMLEASVVSATVFVGLTIQRADGCLYLGGVMRNATLIPIRGPGEVRE